MSDPLAGIAEAPPAVSESEAEVLVERHYGRQVSARLLVSERDRNFLLLDDEWRAVLKIASGAEDPQVTDLQVQAALFLAAGAPALPVPRILPTLSGGPTADVSIAGRQHSLRMVSFLRGEPFEPSTATPTLIRNLGSVLGRLDAALKTFRHPGENQVLAWDMRRAPELMQLVDHISDVALREQVAQTLRDFAERALPQFAALPNQVIHNDANPANLFVNDDATAIAGVIDFGDMLHAPRIVELAVAGAYLRDPGDDPLAALRQLLEGYGDAVPLSREEVEWLPLLVMTRLATTIAMRYWRHQFRDSGDAYRAATDAAEASAGGFLGRLHRVGWRAAGQALQNA